MYELAVSARNKLVVIEFLFSSQRGSTKNITILGNRLVASTMYNTVTAKDPGQLDGYQAQTLGACSMIVTRANAIYNSCYIIDTLDYVSTRLKVSHGVRQGNNLAFLFLMF